MCLMHEYLQQILFLLWWCGLRCKSLNMHWISSLLVLHLLIYNFLISFSHLKNLMVWFNIIFSWLIMICQVLAVGMGCVWVNIFFCFGFWCAALNETLTTEVQRLRLAATECGGEGYLANLMAQQLSINQQMFQLQHAQPRQLYHLSREQQHLLQQQAQLQPQQQNCDTGEQETNQ